MCIWHFAYDYNYDFIISQSEIVWHNTLDVMIKQSLE